MFDQFKKVFFEECQDLLAMAESHLNNLKNNSFELEDIHAIFRSVHSIKGGAGSFGLDQLVNFAHAFETLLDHLRNEKIELTKDISNLLLRANDVLADFVRLAEADSQEIPAQAEEIEQQLRFLYENNSSKKDEKVSKGKIEKTLSHFDIRFNPMASIMQFGNDPLLIIRDVKKKAVDDSFKCDVDFSALPDFKNLSPSKCHIKWKLSLQSYATREEIREAFEFVEDDCDLEILCVHLEREDKKTPTDKMSEDSKKNKQVAQPSSTDDMTVQSIRVDLDRIDRLVNTVGEMVIKQAMILDQAASLNIEGDNLLVKGLQELTQYTRELQESVMSIRAQPVKAVFSRIPRLVRDLSSELDRDIQVLTYGEGTEIDKTVIERLGEPLTHMIRNAVDHGIESPSERIALGKSAQGTIKLSAEHRSGRIVIEISDDGKGINRKRVLEKALEKDLITEEQSSNMTGEDIDNLIFLPGFSTAATVTNISGRGVGMDVVKKSIQALGGRISIYSSEGVGCRFVLTLPLTLAVLDGMIVLCGDQHYIIPLISIIETLRPHPEQITTFVGCHDILHLRDENIPLVYLHSVFNIKGAVEDATQGIVVVVETEGGEHIGIIVDDLLNQQQVVIKSLEANYDPISGISAATILGNGRVALILDVSSLKNVEMTNMRHLNEMETIKDQLHA